MERLRLGSCFGWLLGWLLLGSYAAARQFGVARPHELHASEAGYLPGTVVAYFVLGNPAPIARARFGYDVAVLDFDGDGFEDLAVGVPGKTGALLPGRVEVFRGPGMSWTWTLAPADGQPDDLFGSALGAGDFDGDGADELVGGTPGWDASATVTACGRVAIW